MLSRMVPAILFTAVASGSAARADQAPPGLGVDVVGGISSEHQTRFEPGGDCESRGQVVVDVTHLGIRGRWRAVSSEDGALFIELPVELTLGPTEFPTTVLPGLQASAHLSEPPGEGLDLYVRAGGGLVVTRKSCGGNSQRGVGWRVGGGLRYTFGQRLSVLAEANDEGYFSWGWSGSATTFVGGVGWSF